MRVKVELRIVEAIIGKNGWPRVCLLIQQRGQVEQEWLTSAVVGPEDDIHVVARAGPSPVAQWPGGQRFELMAKVLQQERYRPLIAGRFVVVAQVEQHHHSRPPVIVRCRSEKAAWLLACQRPVD